MKTSVNSAYFLLKLDLLVFLLKSLLCQPIVLRKTLKIPNIVSQRRQWHPTAVLLPGKSHGRRSLVGCSPWGRSESDRTEWLHFHFSLSCIGEGNGNPLQCSCLENPRDRGAWWAAIYGVTQSWTRLKRLSSSSNIFSREKLWGNGKGSPRLFLFCFVF